MPKIIVSETYCKGCGLCVTACPQNIIELDPNKLTQKGYRPARLIDAAQCTGCANCAVMCPDVAITVIKEQ